MSNHLTEDQIAKCVAGQSTRAELKHLADCAECSAELERFGTMISTFSSAIRQRVDARVALQRPGGYEFSLPPTAPGVPLWRWALITAAMVVLVVIPFFTTPIRNKEVVEPRPTEMSPDEVMDAINRHLSRTIPAPMEPILSLMPKDELTTQPGGVQ
jgi:anti-sigma factor RsiW